MDAAALRRSGDKKKVDICDEGYWCGGVAIQVVVVQKSDGSAAGKQRIEMMERKHQPQEFVMVMRSRKHSIT